MFSHDIGHVLHVELFLHAIIIYYLTEVRHAFTKADLSLNACFLMTLVMLYMVNAC